MEKRVYRNAGEKLSIVGFGGIIVSSVEQSEANNCVAEAVDNGINYLMLHQLMVMPRITFSR